MYRQPTYNKERKCIVRKYRTYNKESFYYHVTGHADPRMTHINETSVIRNHDSHVERRNQNEPVPKRFENAVMWYY